MTKFYTRRGDSGRSVLGKRTLPKDDPVFEALGGLDELNSWLGILRAQGTEHKSRNKLFKEVTDWVKMVQEDLFIIQAEIATVAVGLKPRTIISSQKIEVLEKIIEKIDKILPEITKFTIAGGSVLSAQLDFTRAIARRAERGIRKYANEKKLRPELMQYTNRLSSFLFALARYVNFRFGIKEENPRYK